MIIYEPPYSCLATWVYLIHDMDWYRAAEIGEISGRMTCQFDIEEQNINANDCMMADDVIPGKIRPISPVLLSYKWHPEVLFSLDRNQVGVKYGEMAPMKLSHVVSGANLEARSIFDKRIVKVLGRAWKKYGNCNIGLCHSVGWSYSSDMELMPKYRKNCIVNGYIWDHRLVSIMDRIRWNLFG